MSRLDISESLRKLQKVVTKHSPEILTGVGIVGMVSTTIIAVRATPKALILIENKKRDKRFNGDKDPNLTKLELVETTWKCYLPAVVTGVCSVACLVGASSVSARRNAALAAAYTISETALNEYKDKVIATFGEKKEKDVRDTIAKDKIEANPVVNNDIIITNKGETLCYDSLSGRYFKSDIEQIRRATNNLNEQLLRNTYVSLNDFYYEIGLDDISIGSQLGWNIDPDSSDRGLVKLDFSSQLTADGTPCMVIGFMNPPRYDLGY